MKYGESEQASERARARAKERVLEKQLLNFKSTVYVCVYVCESRNSCMGLSMALKMSPRSGKSFRLIAKFYFCYLQIRKKIKTN